MCFLYIFLYKTASEYVDEYGVEFENENKTKLISTSSVLVDYLVPYQCEIIFGGETADESSFRGCKRTIRSLSFEKNSQLRCIYPFCFDNSAIVSIDFSNCDLLEIINSSICSQCYNLTTLKLPPNILATQNNCFDSCYELQDVVFPDTLEIVNSYSFANCYSIKSFHISVQSRLKSIQNDAFIGTGITFLYIPQNLTSINGAAFAGTKIERFEFHPENKAFSSDGKALFNYQKTRIIYFSAAFNGSYTVPSTVTNIYTSSFRLTSLSYIYINHKMKMYKYL